MSAIFLSASVPVIGRGHYYETADPFLIQLAVRELIISTAAINNLQIIWGGHPAITPMIWRICKDLKINYSKYFILYQSRFFEEQFPDENKRFENVVYIEAVKSNLEASLLKLREAMLSRGDLNAAIFIGGMEGVEAEYEIFKNFHPDANVLAVGASGGAARQLAKKIGGLSETYLDNVNFADLFYEWLIIDEAVPHE